MKAMIASRVAASLVFGHVVAVMLTGPQTRAEEAHAAHHDWDYGAKLGPEHWGDLKPEFSACKAGRRQSPIDIQQAQPTDLPPIQFDYHPSPLHIIDNGHTIQINYEPGSSIRVGDHSYVLKQFHFHRPSEESIHGRRYEMSLHLVHADDRGQLAVVAVLLEKGKDNAVVHELWNDLPKQKEHEELRQEIQVKVAELLPVDRGYYTFEGSLTTPPCTENVTWLVLKQPLEVSAEEIAQFSKLYRNNARPTQPLRDRVVKETR